MSSSNPTFVKTHSRRRPSRSGQGPVANSSQPNASSNQNDVEFRLDRMTPPPEQGSVRVDPSVADSAELWVDSVENEIARADNASSQIPKPHVSPQPTPVVDEQADRQTPQIEIPDSNDTSSQVIDTSIGNPSQSIIEKLESLQHQIDTSVPLVDSMSIDIIASTNAMNALVEETHAAVEETSEAASPSSSEETTVVPSETPHEADPGDQAYNRDDITTRRIDSADDTIQSARQRLNDVQKLVDEATQDETLDPSLSVPASDPIVEPFQSAWEVDVFDVPKVVADLFFEGQLFHQIAEQMLDAVNNGLSSVLVTSVHSGEGRSSVAIGVAMAAAAAGIRVAILDLDTHQPTLADDLRLDLEYGWTDSIRLGLPIKEVAVHAVDDGVTLIPLLNRGASATEEEVTQVIELLKSRFELIIVDGPSGAESLVDRIAGSVDSAIVVHRPINGEAVLLNSLCERLQRAEIQGIGLVENFS